MKTRHNKSLKRNTSKVRILCILLLFLTGLNTYGAVCYYWVFKDPMKNPIVPSANFLGYWLPPLDNPGQSFTVDGTEYQFATDNRPKGPFFDKKGDEVIHDGLDLFAWLEKVDGKCYIHFFKTTDVVKPTLGGIIETVKTGDDGAVNIVHAPEKPMDTYETYGHIKPGADISMGTEAPTSLSLGTLSDLGADTFIHLHYSMFVGGVAVDPLSFMERKSTTCDNVVPAPGALVLGAVGTGLVGCLRRRKAA